MALFLIRQISHSVAKFIIWCIHKLIDCVFAIRFAIWMFFWYRSNATIPIAQYWLTMCKNWVLVTTGQIIFGNPYHRCVLENQGFCPQTATAFGTSRHSMHIIRWDYPQFIILRCVAKRSGHFCLDLRRSAPSAMDVKRCIILLFISLYNNTKKFQMFRAFLPWSGLICPICYGCKKMYYTIAY